MTWDEQQRDEWLTLYAAGALDREQSAKVEALLESDRDAADELAQIRALLAQVARAAPRPSAEPDWRGMAAGIRDATRAQPSWKQRLLRLTAPRVAIPAVLAVAAAIAVLAVLPQSDPSPATQAMPDPGDEVVNDESPAILDEPAVDLALADLALADLGEMDGEQLSALDESLSTLEPAFLVDPDDLADGEREDALADDEAVDSGPAPHVDVYGELADDWIDDLSDEELERVAVYLAAQAG
jgi:hypothetical protein